MIAKKIECEVEGRAGKIPGLEFRSRTYSSSEHWNGEMDVAVITISYQHAKRLLGLMDLVRGLAQADPQVNHLVVHDYSVLWFEGDYDKVRRDPETGEEIPAPKLDPESSEHGGIGDKRTEYDYVRVYDDHVIFQATPKHGDVDVSTDEITRATLEQLVRPPRKKVRKSAPGAQPVEA